MYVSYQLSPVNECLITPFTGIRALTTMYALVGYKNAVLIECLITHFTDKRVLTTMYAFMS